MPLLHHLCPHCQYPVYRSNRITCGREECLESQRKAKADDKVFIYKCPICEAPLHRKDVLTCGANYCRRQLRLIKKNQTTAPGLDSPLVTGITSEEAKQYKDKPLPDLDSLKKPNANEAYIDEPEPYVRAPFIDSLMKDDKEKK